MRKQSAFKRTRLVFMSAIRALGAATLLFIGLILFDTEAQGDLMWQAVACGAISLVAVRLAWLIWLLNRIVGISLEDQSRDDQPRPFKEPLDDSD